MKISEIGEFGLIEKLSKIIKQGSAKGKDVRRPLIGIGDDAAVYISDHSIQFATVDSLVQDVHFSLSYMSWRELGWKSIAVNLSDIAAMGGLPLYALVSLGLPGDTELKNVTDLYRGMLDIANRFGVGVVGGDTVTSPFVFISVTVLAGAGTKNERFLRRSAARVGDEIAVTNYLGTSAAGLEMLRKNLKFGKNFSAKLRAAHLKPYPRLTEGRVLVEKGVKCGMDISDGLVGDLMHICQESKVSARINVNLVPISPAVKRSFGKRALELALTGGEDYELLFTASPRVMSQVKKTIQCPITIIGKITAEKIGKVTLLDGMGKKLNLKKTAWDHFSNRSIK
jgi:thiamine-monophosphate kinase